MKLKYFFLYIHMRPTINIGSGEQNKTSKVKKHTLFDIHIIAFNKN
jgi:hypothetical protein